MRHFLIVPIILAMVAGCGENGAVQRDAERSPSAAEQKSASSGNDYPMLATKSVDAATAKRVMHERHEGMEAIGKSAKALRRALGDRQPDLGLVRSEAGKIAALSPKVAGWFPPGTGPEVGKTGARPAIWEQPRDFAAKAQAFDVAAQSLKKAAARGDVAAMTAAFGNLGKSCKACHDPYRKEMH